ncbi:hypothetical protein TNCV_5027091 [Trichonephila clavipes]|nr:hypothetical protein TNCV_5027091 [Trichonephila clavipes]
MGSLVVKESDSRPEDLGSMPPNTFPSTYGVRFHEISGFESLVDSDEYIRLRESDCEEPEESANEIDNIPVIPDTYVVSYDTEWIRHNGPAKENEALSQVHTFGEDTHARDWLNCPAKPNLL